MKYLILTQGLPQSGKSTWAKAQGHPIVNRDSIRLAIGGSIRYFSEEDRVSEIERIMVRALFAAGHDKVILDATHLKLKYITAWEEFAKSFTDMEIRVSLVPFYTSLEECIERAMAGFPEDDKFPLVIRSMWKGSEIGFIIPEFKINYGESG